MYEHHCIRQLPPAARKLRKAAAYLVQHSMVVQWALELHGFQDVSIKVIAPFFTSCTSRSPYSMPCLKPTEGFFPGPSWSMACQCQAHEHLCVCSAWMGHNCIASEQHAVSQAEAVCCLQVQSSHLAKPFSAKSGAEEDVGDLFKSPSPVLANVRFTINLSL